ncbi:MAG TPA: hypothetical protein VKU19_32240 [Bryobacteraceae bacterium]|nr:hypothetical protein [Bryobacteraceae bacterium]
MNRTLFRIAAFLLVVSGVGLVVLAQSTKPRRPASFDYYLLVLSYAPDFCAEGGSQKDPEECGANSHDGFVVHGLWPQGETSRGPENCAPGGPLPAGLIPPMLKYFPSESLLRHEWKAHGSCTGLSAAEYLAAIKKGCDSVKIPAELTPASRESMSAAEIEDKVARANPSFPKAAFRTSCYPDRELKEIRVCLSKDLSPRACGISAGRCSASSVTLLPVH